MRKGYCSRPVCKRALKQLYREQTNRRIHTHTHTHTHTQDKYRNPRACAPRVNEVDLPFYCLLMIHRTFDERGCANVRIEQEVRFDVTVTMDQCLSGIQR